MVKFTPVIEFISAMRMHQVAFRWIRDRHHQVWYAYAMVLALLVFAFNWWGMHVFHQWIEGHLVRLGVGEFVSSWTDQADIQSIQIGQVTRWQSYMDQAVEVVFKFVFWVLAIWFEIKTMKYVLLALSGPFVSWVSEQTESNITGVAAEFNALVWSRDLIRSVVFSAILFFAEIAVSMLSLGSVLVSWVFFPALAPIFSVSAIILEVVLSSFVFGMASFDPVWERKGLGFRSRFSRAWSDKWKLMGLGLPFHMAMATPFISAFLAPIFLPILSGVGAVLIVMRSENEQFYS